MTRRERNARKGSRATKRALTSSILAIVLCAVLLAGATFAWFTDTASTKVSKIESGTLKVELQYYDATEGKYVSAEGKSLDFVPAEGQTSILWEPNATYTLPQLKVVNKGNLALKYKVVVSAIEGDKELANVLNVTLTDGTNDPQSLGTLKALSEKETTNILENHLAAKAETAALTVSVQMDKDAGNAYQGKTITGVTVSVIAAQDTVEVDGTGSNKYDENATYATVVKDEAELTAALGNIATSAANVSIMLAEDVDLTKGITTANNSNLDVNFGGKTITAATGTGSGNTTNGMQLLKGSAVTLKDGTYAMNPKSIHYLIQNYSNLTIDNMELSTVDYSQLGNNAINSGMAVISTNCGNVTITGNTNITAHQNSLALDICHWESSYPEGTSVTFDENFTGVCDGGISIYCYRNNSVDKSVTDGGATLTIKSGTFKNTGLTFEQFKAYVPAGYTATESNGVYTVTPTP